MRSVWSAGSRVEARRIVKQITFPECGRLFNGVSGKGNRDAWRRWTNHIRFSNRSPPFLTWPGRYCQPCEAAEQHPTVTFTFQGLPLCASVSTHAQNFGGSRCEGTFGRWKTCLTCVRHREKFCEPKHGKLYIRLACLCCLGEYHQLHPQVSRSSSFPVLDFYTFFSSFLENR